MKPFISDEEKAQMLANALPKDGEAVHIMRKGRLVKAIYRKWIIGTQFAEVEYQGETIKEHLYECLDGKETPQKIDLIHWHEAAKAEATKPVAVPLSEFERPLAKDDPNELLSRRFLCRGGGMLFVGPTGIGKSSFTMQAMIQWAIGNPAFGIQPAWQLKSLLIQAENDEGDIAEMRDGVMDGLDLTDEEEKLAGENIIVCNDNSSQSGRFFQRIVRPLLEEHKDHRPVDLLVIDPALAYLGGETNSQKDVGGFLRNDLNPLLKEFNVAAIIIHHTNKPPSGKEKATWQGNELSYLGSGSAEWANWARAVLALRGSGKVDVYGQQIFELCAPKRGGRLDWRDANSERSYSKYVRHSREPGVICWHEVDEGEVVEGETSGSKRAGKEDQFVQDVLEVLGKSETQSTAYLIELRRVSGVGDNRARQLLNQLISEKRIVRVEKKREGKKPEIHYALNDGRFESE